MSTTMDLTAASAILKDYYIAGYELDNLVYEEQPFLAMVPKMENFTGDGMPLPLQYGNPQNRSINIANALNGVSTSKLGKFFLYRQHNFSVANLDGETMEATADNIGAFTEAMKIEMDGAIHSLSRNLGTALFRDGSGAIGRVNNGTLNAVTNTTTALTATTIDLVQANDVVNFEVGMVLVLSGTSIGGTVRTGQATVTGVNRTATSNQVTIDQPLNTDVPAVVTLDYIYPQGDYNTANTNGQNVGQITGLSGWLNAPNITSTDSFMGLNRFADVTRLGGLYLDASSTGTSLPIEEALITAAVLVSREGGKPTDIFMSHSQFGNLEKALGAKVVYTEVGSGKWGFDALKIRTPAGTMNVVPDVNCQPDQVWMLQMDTWKLYSLGKAPKLVEEHDGLVLLRNPTADTYQARIVSRAQLGCKAPGWNCRIKVNV